MFNSIYPLMDIEARFNSLSKKISRYSLTKNNYFLIKFRDTFSRLFYKKIEFANIIF